MGRIWIVVYGDEAPEVEKNEAIALAAYLRRGLNLAMARPESTVGDALDKIANFLILGGPIATPKWGSKYNEITNPKIDMSVAPVKAVKTLEDGTTQEWVFPVVAPNRTYNMGIIGAGVKPHLSLVPLKVHTLIGYTFEDTCGLVKAYMEGFRAGIYECYYTPVPDMTKCPEDITYRQIADP